MTNTQNRVEALKDTVHREMFEKTKGVAETLASYHYDHDEDDNGNRVDRMRDMVGLNRQINRADS